MSLTARATCQRPRRGPTPLRMAVVRRRNRATNRIMHRRCGRGASAALPVWRPIGLRTCSLALSEPPRLCGGAAKGRRCSSSDGSGVCPRELRLLLRLPSTAPQRDRAARAADRGRGAVVAGDLAADDRAGRRRDRGGRRSWLPSATSAASPTGASWRPASAWTRACASPPTARLTHGHISRQGSSSGRHALVEACWSTVREPGPIDRRKRPRARHRAAHQVGLTGPSRAADPRPEVCALNSSSPLPQHSRRDFVGLRRAYPPVDARPLVDVVCATRCRALYRRRR